MSYADDPHVLSPDLLPTPFSADEIRDGCPAGRTCRTLVEPADAKPSDARLSIQAPVGRALHGARAGEVVQVRTPSGVRALRILAVT